MHENDIVTDADGSEWRLGTLLGSGGEGEVRAVVGHPLAVKVHDSARPEALRRRLTRVSRLPLDGLPIAGVERMLSEPETGYVMRLMADTTPWRDVLLVPPGQIRDWYQQTGGLRRRLELLAALAETLEELHGRGIAFRDLSPANVLITPVDEVAAVWLIDPDNLGYTTERRRFWGTPGYMAPELAREEISVPDTVTDAHSLAVLVVHTLSTVHPLLGGDLVDEDDDMRPAALRGEVPWIDDPDDDRNRSSEGIPRSIVLTRRLRALAERAFGPGLRDAFARPSTSEWAAAIRSAADISLTCPHCAMTFYASAKSCPWCRSPRAAYGRLTFGIWCGADQLGLTHKRDVVLDDGGSRTISATLARPWDRHASGDVAEISYDSDGFSYRALVSGTWLGRANGQELTIGAAKRLNVSPGKKLRQLVHFGSENEPHRAVSFSVPLPGR